MKWTERYGEVEVEMHREKEIEWEVEEKWRELGEVGGRGRVYFRLDNMDLMHNSFTLKIL